MTYNVEEYKNKLNSGNRTAILAFVLNEMQNHGITPNPAHPVTDTTTGKATGVFNTNALQMTKLFEDGNDNRTNKDVLAHAIAQAYGEMELADAQLKEIDRIAKGDKFGAGRGMEQGQVKNVIEILERIEAKIDKLAGGA